MTDSERNLLIWCAVMLVRDTPLTAAEAAEIDQLICSVRTTYPVKPKRRATPCRIDSAASRD